MTIRIASHLAVAFFILAPNLQAGEKINDFQLGFTFVVPDGFVRVPGEAKGKVLYVFQKPGSRGQFGTKFGIGRLGGTIGREKIETSQVAGIHRDATASTEKWKEFDIFVMRFTETVEGRRVVLLNAQVPLAGEAIQVSVVGDPSREEELRALLKTVLRDLDGKSNWLTDGERADTALYVLASVGFIILLWLWRRKARPEAGRAQDSQPAKSTTADRYVGRGVLVGIAIGAIGGAVVGSYKLFGGLDSSFVGALLGAVLGLMGGMILGLLTMLFARPSDKATVEST
jgi:hypothetical protein